MAGQPITTSLSYETSLFGLLRTKASAEKFIVTLEPGQWEALSFAEVSLKTGKLHELKMELGYWKQTLVIACSTKEDGLTLLQNNEVIIDECDKILDTSQRMITSAREFCEKMESDAHAAAKKQESENKRAVAQDSDFKLEKIKPPTFSGNYSEWQSYSDLFKAAVIDNPKISGGLKLVYLKNSLVGDAAYIAASFPPTNLSFQEAWTLVERRYNKKREIVFAHLDNLFGLPNTSDTSVSIRKMIDTINQCTRSLKLLAVEVGKWDVFIVYWAHLKLDPETRKQWLLDSDDELPKLSEFLDFLEKRATALSIPIKTKGKSSDKSSSSHHASTGKPKPGCPMCSERHKIVSCPKFLELVPKQRSNHARQHKLCLNCLANHKGECRNDPECRSCGRPHHSLLHFARSSTNQGSRSNPIETQSGGHSSNQSNLEETPPTVTPTPESSSSVQVVSHHSSVEDIVVLMATLLVSVRDSNGQNQVCRVFVDQGSEANFISESLVNRLSLRRQGSCVKVTGIGGSVEETARGIVDFNAQSNHHNFSLPVRALILPKLTGFLPREPCRGQFPHIEGLPLADPNFHHPAAIDILLGAEAASQIVLPGLRRGPPGTPTAQNSRFGWFLTGSAPGISLRTSNFTVRVCHSTCTPDNECLESSLKRFWELDDPSPPPEQLCPEDESCEKYFLKTFTRDPEGRFQVNLPFSFDPGDLGESQQKAISCFKSLERKLEQNEELKFAYHSQIAAYIANNWVEKISEVDLNKGQQVKVSTLDGKELSLPPYYLPHHIVVKEDSSTTKFRIVFNASSKTTNGNSLNSLVIPGPKIQTDLHPLLTRFRSHPMALSADIVKFYHQVKVNPPECDFQRFVYRKNPSDSFSHLRFLRLTFGVSPSSYLSIRVLRQLGEENKEEFPLAYQAINNDFLVDNLLSGASTMEKALEVKVQIEEVLRKGKFPLQKWASNIPELISTIPQSDRENFSMDLREDDSIKTIGLYWHPMTDMFGVKILDIPTVTTTTKREILSHVSRVFDPLQWLAPVTIKAKILLQKLWKAKIGWDDPIPQTHLLEWRKYCSELPLLRKFRVPRCLTFTTFTDFSKIKFDLVGFCDASNSAYAACVYLRSKYDNECKVELIACKSKVTPVAGETTPRLELCSAVVLLKLINNVSTALLPTKIKISNFSCFTDSTGVLGQIFSKDKQPVFVANRIRKIRNSPITIHWFHVPGDQNPADAPSRGISPSQFLQDPLWLHGPKFLITGELPPQPHQETVASFFLTSDAGSTFVNDLLTRLIKNKSSFVQMKRLVGYWIRLQNNFRTGAVLTSGPLTTQELEIAQKCLVKCTQSACFPNELDLCARKKEVKGQIKFLSPFLDKDGILRVGGRLQKSELTFSQNHPILLPKFHTRPNTPEQKIFGHLVLTIARHYHEENLHAGPKLLLSQIRTEFWIPRGQNLCGRVFRMCLKCFKANPRASTQVMGQLPSSRVVPDFPFFKVGIDYAGPFQIAVTPGRKPRLIKAWVCVFICMATKAVHLEFSGGLSTPDFISALQRLCSIRNSPSDIHCDGGTNFRGAKTDQESLQQLLASPKHREKVALFFSGTKTKFHFSPPLGPHHGGLWEAAVKSMKLHLHRVTQGHHVSIEEFITLLARTSAALNSRPLTPLSNNPDDFEAITPFHFISLRGPTYIPEEDVTNFKSHRSRWQLVQQMTQHLFQRWSSDYLQSLQQKHKWLEPHPNIQKGMMVLVQDVDSNFKHQSWVLARIEAVYPGSDGRVRQCDVRIPIHDPDGKKTKKFTVLKRPITRIAPLPIDDNVTTAYATLLTRI